MDRATREGAALRCRIDSRGPVEVEAAAGLAGVDLGDWAEDRWKERAGRAASGHGTPEKWRRWLAAHAIGHQMIHGDGGQWRERHGEVDAEVELEAEGFAWALLVDEREAETMRFREPWQVAAFFRVPEEVVRGHWDMPGLT